MERGDKMQISLFTCTAENERVDKTDYITNRFVMDGAFRNESSVVDPVIVIEKTNPSEFLYNYMYIPAFKRWYYINDYISVRNNLWEIHAHVDVLYTWRASISEMKAVIDKTQSGADANLYMDDGSFVMDSRKYNKVITFPYGLSQNGEFILICAGGQGGSQAS